MEHLIGDRKDNLTALEGKSWDAVIDNSGHDASWTDQSAALLKDQCDLYVYTSSTGVYYPYLKSGYVENDPVLLEEPAVVADEIEKIEYWYGVMKARSEQAAIQHFGADRTIVVRPTYMIGPADKTNRFIHWPLRLKQGGDVLVPGKASDPVQYIDVRDVAQWTVRLMEGGHSGTFNAVGPRSAQTMGAFIAEAQQAFNTPSNFIHVEDYAFLQSKGILDLVPWILPEGNNFGSSLVSNAKALDHGLSFTPLKATLLDTYAWWISSAVPDEVRAEVENNPNSVLQRERELLDQWSAYMK